MLRAFTLPKSRRCACQVIAFQWPVRLNDETSASGLHVIARDAGCLICAGAAITRQCLLPKFAAARRYRGVASAVFFGIKSALGHQGEAKHVWRDV